jgi:anti-anti-sigma factor
MDLAIETIPLQDGAATLVSVNGELDLATSEDLKQIPDNRDSASCPILLDLSDCSFVDSVALGRIVLLSRLVDASGKPVRVAVVASHGSQIGRLFMTSGAHQALQMFETRAGALASLDRRSNP